MRSSKFKAAIVTGGTGVVGYALIKLLISKNISVHLFVRDKHNIKCLEEFRNQLQVYEVPLSDYEDYRPSTSADVFFHLAWEGTSKTDRQNEAIQFGNLKHIKHAVRIAKQTGCQKFIGIGSQAEFGHQSTPMGAHSVAGPHTFYGIAKLAAGQLSKQYCNIEKIDFNWVRIFSVFGVCDNSNTLMEYVLNQIRVDSEIQITNPDAIWDYMFNDDAAEALCMIAEKGLDGKTYSLGSGVGIKILDIINRVLEITASKTKIKINSNPIHAGGISYLVADTDELQKDIQFKHSNTFDSSFIRYWHQIKFK